MYNEAAGYARSASLTNSMVFTAKAGDMCLFDISTFHTSMPNTSDRPRDALITGYGRPPKSSPTTNTALIGCVLPPPSFDT